MNQDLILLLSNVITAAASFLAGRRRSNADTDNAILRNVEISVGIYQTLIEDLKLEILALNNKIIDLERKIDELHQENKTLKAGL